MGGTVSVNHAGHGEMKEIYATLVTVWLGIACFSGWDEVGALPFSGDVVRLLLSDVILPVLAILLAATMVLRLHDVGRSGICLFFLIMPVLGWIFLWYLYYRESRIRENKYEDPAWN